MIKIHNMLICEQHMKLLLLNQTIDLSSSVLSTVTNISFPGFWTGVFPYLTRDAIN